MTQEQKAKAYDEAIKKLRNFYRDYDTVSCLIDVKEELANLFPELRESEDERIRKNIIAFIKENYSSAKPWIAWLEKQSEENMIEALRLEYEKGKSDALQEQRKEWTSEDLLKRNEIADILQEYNRDDLIDWLEKRGENSLVNFDEAEKEKYDFVSGQYIECRASFNEFKEDNSYWLEYIGNDTYIGRSDNILNQKFHITPRQLYCLFTQQHCPKEDNTNDETNAPTEYGKYVDECLNEAAKHFFSEGENTYSVADLFYAGVRCGKSWLEKQGEQKVPINDFKARVLK